MQGARYVRLIPWTLHSGSEQLGSAVCFQFKVEPTKMKRDFFLLRSEASFALQRKSYFTCEMKWKQGNINER
jgi:hypothetical protein